MKMIPRNLHLTLRQITRLEALKKKTGLSVAEHVRRAVDRYLDREERKHGVKGKADQ